MYWIRVAIKLSKEIIIGLVLLLSTVLVGGIANYNGWAWQIEAVASDMRGVEYQLIVERKRKISGQIYRLESDKANAPDEWNARDELRLHDLMDELEQTDVDLDRFVEADVD